MTEDRVPLDHVNYVEFVDLLSAGIGHLEVSDYVQITRFEPRFKDQGLVLQRAKFVERRQLIVID